MKSRVIIIPILLIMIIATLFIGSKIYNSKNTWNCEDGEWVKQGNPQSEIPNTPCIGKTVTQKRAQINPEGVVNNFYTWLIKEEPTALITFEASPDLSGKLMDSATKQLTNNPDQNPFTCSTEILKKAAVKLVSNNNTQAVVSVTETFPKSSKIIAVNLKPNGANWEINSVTCP